MYALKEKSSGKLMAIEPETNFGINFNKLSNYEDDDSSFVEKYLRIKSPSIYDRMIFVTSEKWIAYALAKNESVDGMKMDKGCEVEVIKLKVKRAKHKMEEK